MAAKEMYDYVSTVSPDYAYTLDMAPHDQLVEDGQKNVRIHEFDDESESRIIVSDTSVFFVTLMWKHLSEANAGTLWDLYHDTAKACGMAKSFRWLNYGEPSGSRHTYVVRFASPLPREIVPAALYSFTSIQLKVLGRIADP